MADQRERDAQPIERANALTQLCRQYHVDILYVFGSRAKEVKLWLENEDTELLSGPSDVDVGVKPTRGTRLSLQEKVELALAVEDLLGVTRVDLISFDDADPFLAANMVRGERLYAANDHLADEYDLYVLRRAGDTAPMERERIALILERE